MFIWNVSLKKNKFFILGRRARVHRLQVVKCVLKKWIWIMWVLQVALTCKYISYLSKALTHFQIPLACLETSCFPVKQILPYLVSHVTTPISPPVGPYQILLYLFIPFTICPTNPMLPPQIRCLLLITIPTVFTTPAQWTILLLLWTLRTRSLLGPWVLISPNALDINSSGLRITLKTKLAGLN